MKLYIRYILISLYPTLPCAALTWPRFLQPRVSQIQSLLLYDDLSYNSTAIFPILAHFLPLAFSLYHTVCPSLLAVIPVAWIVVIDLSSQLTTTQMISFKKCYSICYFTVLSSQTSQCFLFFFLSAVQSAYRGSPVSIWFHCCTYLVSAWNRYDWFKIICIISCCILLYYFGPVMRH